MTVTAQLAAANEYMTLWQALMPDLPAPAFDQFVIWAGTHTAGLVSQGINRAARKARKLRDTPAPMTTEDATRYASSVMKNELLGNRRFSTGDHRDGDTNHRPSERFEHGSNTPGGHRAPAHQEEK